MAVPNIRLMYVHELQAGRVKFNDRVDVWEVDEAGVKSNWIGALIRNEVGDIEAVGEVPEHLVRNLTLMLQK